MSKDLQMSILMDFYGQMLTQKQQDTLDLYYNDDLSLGEIAEHLGITRQGVRDTIKRGEKQLTEFEQVLGLARRFSHIQEKFLRIGRIVWEIRQYECPNDITVKLDEIEKISRTIREEL